MTRHGFILGLVCLLDLIITTVGLKLNVISEANVMLSYYYHYYGLIGFILAKLSFTIVPIAIIELIHHNKKAFRAKIKKYYIAATLIIICTLIFAFIRQVL